MPNPFRYFFQKRQPAVSPTRATMEQRMRFNPLMGFDPDRLVRAIDSFRAGDIADLARIIEDLEERDDKMCACSRKMRSSVSRCPHQVLIAEGYEGEEKALKHQEILTKFWGSIKCTSALKRNERGGIRLLKKQMMNSMSQVFAVHEIVWKPKPDGTITADFVSVPLWFFENRTGELRFLPNSSMYDGEVMPEGEWLVTTGDGVGIAASMAACGKKLSIADWLLYSEHCGIPGLHGKTTAAQGTPAWENMLAGLRSFGREWAMLTDSNSSIDPVSLASTGTLPYKELAEYMDKAISALYRGADLSTMSAGNGDVGASVQGEESDLLEQDACEMLSETLQEQVERFVIRYATGDEQPLAYIQITPVSNPDATKEMEIDKHLVGFGVKLSKNEALQRYQRTEVDDTDETDSPLVAVQQTPSAAPWQSTDPATTALANEKGKEPVAKPLQNDLDTPARSAEQEKAKTQQGASDALLSAFAKDMNPVGKAVALLLEIEDPEERKAAAAKIIENLPSLLADDPEMAAVMEEALAESFTTTLEKK